uniref:BESS domain-containing protein n=2 Tax=Caenorhabditis tropicalis TaxID=1561998 RepID=A0A1I7UU14_9PELO
MNLYNMQKKGQILCDVKQEKVDFAKKAEKFHEIFNIESNGTPRRFHRRKQQDDRTERKGWTDRSKIPSDILLKSLSYVVKSCSREDTLYSTEEQVLLLVPLLEKRFDSDLVKKMQKDVTTRNQEINKLVEDGLLAPVPTSRNVLEPSCSTR